MYMYPIPSFVTIRYMVFCALLKQVGKSSWNVPIDASDAKWTAFTADFLWSLFWRVGSNRMYLIHNTGRLIAHVSKANEKWVWVAIVNHWMAYDTGTSILLFIFMIPANHRKHYAVTLLFIVRNKNVSFPRCQGYLSKPARQPLLFMILAIKFY